MKALIKFFLLTLILGVVNVYEAEACPGFSEVEWDGSESSDWSDPDNYSSGNLPDDEIVIVDANNYINAPVINSTPSFNPYRIQLDNDATLTLNASTATVDLEIEGGNNNLIIGAGAALTLADDLYFSASGAISISGGGDLLINDEMRFNDPNSIITNSLNGDIVISDNISFESSACTLNNFGRITVNGDISTSGVTSNANTVNNNSGAHIRINGDINFSNGANNDIINQGLFTVSGTYLNINPSSSIENQNGGTWTWNYTNSTWDPDILSVMSTDGTFVYGANSNQNIIAIDYRNLTISGSGQKNLMGNTQINGALTLNNGYISLGDNDLTVSTTGSISGGSSSSAIITNGEGSLVQQNIGASGRTGDIRFPVGTSTSSYTPLTINNTSGTSDDFSVRLIEQIMVDGSSGTPQLTEVVGRTWFIDEAVEGGSDVTLTFQWNDAEGLVGFDPADMHIIHYNGSGWEKLWSGAAMGTGPYTATVTGVNDFSPFGLEGSSTPLPVELIYFTAKHHDDRVVLDWSTASELNNDYFILERSVNLQNFDQIGIIQGQGTTSSSTNYNYIDTKPYGGVSFYRLTQVDFDGAKKVYNPVKVIVSSVGQISASVYPVPSDGESLKVHIMGYDKTLSADLKIMSVNGEVLHLEEIFLDEKTGFEKEIFFNQPLPAGLYVLKVSTPKPIIREVLIK